MKHRIYISGKISGTDDYAERFGEAARELRAQGYEPVNPALLGIIMPEDADHDEYMKMCIQLLEFCDSIYMLPGWQDSPGASMEYGYALAADKIIIRG